MFDVSLLDASSSRQGAPITIPRLHICSEHSSHEEQHVQDLEPSIPVELDIKRIDGMTKVRYLIVEYFLTHHAIDMAITTKRCWYM